jgi:hypothetical protein
VKKDELVSPNPARSVVYTDSTSDFKLPVMFRDEEGAHKNLNFYEGLNS